MKNHFVPEFYFKPWLDGGTLLRFGKINGRLTVDPKTPGQICYIKDHHTFTGEYGPNDAHATEHWLGRSVDDKAAPAIRRILDEGIESISDAQRTSLAIFIDALIVRKPESIDMLRHGVPDEYRRNLARLSPETDDVNLVDHVWNRHPSFIENSWSVMISDIIADGRFARRILELDWWTANFSKTSIGSICTSDRPVCIGGDSLEDPELFTAFPISPNVVVFTTTTDAKTRFRSIGLGQLGLRTQKAFIATAKDFVFADKHVNRNLVASYLRSREPVQL